MIPSFRKLVNDRLKKEQISNLHFVATDTLGNVEKNQEELKYDLNDLRNTKGVHDRVLLILEFCERYSTFDVDGELQCEPNRNRSCVDIWRIYKRYFGKVSIFTIMNSLYYLVVETTDVYTLFCRDINKQVFILDSDDSSVEEITSKNEFGVRFVDWNLV